MKMLLVGELNETLYSLNEYMMSDFQIQMCTESVKNVRDMVRLLRPSIIVMNITEMNEEIINIFEMLSSKLSAMPIVVIGTAAMTDELTLQLDYFKNMKILTRPLNAKEVHKACLALLKMENAASVVAEITENKKERKVILVVDDNALILRRMKQLLEDEYQVLLANSGEKAVDIVNKNKVNFILLDYDMPGMSGREVLEIVKTNDLTKDIPVVFLTSVAEKEQIMDVLVNKPYGYILKPPANDKIISIIKEALGEV